MSRQQTTAPAPAGDTAFFGHPRGLSTLFFTEIWERASYYGIRPLLLLFMTDAVTRGGYGFSAAEASAIVGIYAGSVFLLALPGGWLADRWLGARRAVLAGAVLIMSGHLAIGLSALLSRPAFFAGLVLIPLGSGLMKPSISSMVGALYARDDIRRDSGFSIFYMSVNIGAFFGYVVTGLLGERVGWHWGFGAAGAGMFIGLVTYWLRAPRTLAHVEPPPPVSPALRRRIIAALAVIAALVAGVFAAAAAGLLVIDAQKTAGAMGVALAAIGALYLLQLFVAGGLTAAERRRVAVITALFLFAALFWAGLEQAPTSMNLFARDLTDRVIFGFEIPASWLQTLNPLFIVLLTPAMAALWTGLRRRGVGVSSPAQFAAALALAGGSFVVLYLGVQAARSGLVSPLWLAGCVLLQVVAELSLSPVGLSAISGLAPEGRTSQMLGLWFLASAIGNLMAGLLGGAVDASDLDRAGAMFMGMAAALFGAAVVLALLARPLRLLLLRTD